MSNRNRNFTFFEGLVILVVMLNNFFIPISTAGYSIWHFLYWLVSFSAFAMFTLFYEEKLNEKDNEINYLKKIINESKK